jgi:threonylcarbamoyladenosine tRNA methylthiotransferase MtaB
MKRIAFNTLGCRLNQYETDALVTVFRDAGYQIVKWNDDADAYIINTCTVTDKSDRKSRALINQAIRSAGAVTAGQPAAADAIAVNAPVIVVTGCFVENKAGGLSTDDRITYAIDNDRKAGIFTIVDSHLRGDPVSLDAIGVNRFSFRDPGRGFHTRSAVKIQDGCDNSCSFCIIPRVRGRGVSRPMPDVLEQVSESIEAGAKEIVLTGVNIGRYRYGDSSFSYLLEEILNIDGDFRVRVSSIEPDAGVSQNGDSWESGFLELLDHPKLCAHLHLCLQSGSDTILKAMRRRYTVSGFLGFVDTIRKQRPEFNLTTDIIVGFPGETEEDFSQTLKVVEAAGFSHIHTFPYSVREGTKAAGLEDQIGYQEKARRAKIVREISVARKRSYRSNLIGKHQRLLVEKIEKGVATGYGEFYVPIQVPVADIGDNDDRCKAELAPNTFVPVRLSGLSTGDDPVLIGARKR